MNSLFLVVPTIDPYLFCWGFDHLKYEDIVMIGTIDLWYVDVDLSLTFCKKYSSNSFHKL